MFTSSGKLIYNPTRTMKSNTDWWCMVELPNDQIANYYRWHLDRNWWEGDTHSVKRNYCKPPHRSHISVIRGEVPRKNKDQWGKFMANQTIKFQYDNVIRQTSIERDGKDYFWFIDAWFDDYCKIRDFFGLDYKRNGVFFKGHITIARVH